MSNKSRTKAIFTSIDAEVLHREYQQSVRSNPEMHPLYQRNPQADFLSWCSGVKSAIGNSQLRSYIQGSGQPVESTAGGGAFRMTTGKGTGGIGSIASSKNLPDNVRQVVDTYKTGNRSAVA